MINRNDTTPEGQSLLLLLLLISRNKYWNGSGFFSLFYSLNILLIRFTVKSIVDSLKQALSIKLEFGNFFEKKNQFFQDNLQLEKKETIWNSF